MNKKTPRPSTQHNDVVQATRRAIIAGAAEVVSAADLTALAALINAYSGMSDWLRP